MARQFRGPHSPDNIRANQDASGPDTSTPDAGARKAPETAAAGQVSASGASRFSGRRARQVELRAMLLFLVPTPLLFAAFGALSHGRPQDMAGDLAAYICLIGGAFMVREGQKAAAAYAARKLARPPVLPRLICAAGLAGLGVGIACALGWGLGLAASAFFGALTVGAHLAAFGIDPLRSKGLGQISSAELDRVSEAIAKAEETLVRIETRAASLRDREINTRLASINATVRGMLRTIEEDPRDLSRARRYLSVYLKGADEATRKYAENPAMRKEPAMRQQYLALLNDLHAGFERGREALLQDDRTDLEVEIEVLRDRLGQEGA